MHNNAIPENTISQPMHTHSPPSSPPPPIRPHTYFGFAPFHQPPAPPLPPRLPLPEPSLSLTLEQPEPFSHPQQHYHPPHRLLMPPSRVQQPPPQPLRPSTVRAFDLEQSLQPAEQPLQSAANTQPMEPTNQIPEISQTQQRREVEHLDNPQSSPRNGLSSEQADGQQLQLVPATEFPPHDQSDEQQYPLPLATHDAVVQDRELFMTTLDNFLAALGTRLTVPKVEGNELNLHELYCEVTARGGLEQVIRHALWMDLVEVLGILIPLPSAPFVLRKHYMNLLYHYEQVYFSRIEGQLRSLPVPLPAPQSVVHVADSGSAYEVPPEIGSALKKRKRKLDPMQVFGVDPAASVGSIVTGAISGKFDEGYLVSVIVGQEKLSGVLYHVSEDNTIQQFASVPSLLDGVGSEWDVPGLEIQLQGKKKKELPYKRDPNAPRRTRTGYNIFYKEQRARLRQIHPEKNREASRMVIEMWSRLPEAEKSLYVERGQQERERYKKEYQEYKERMRLQSQTGDEINAAGQPLLEHDHGVYDGSHDYHVSLDVEGDMMSFQGTQQHVSEMDELHSGQGYPVDEDLIRYHVNGLQSHVPGSDTSGGHLNPDQAFETQEEGEYADEPQSGEEGNADLEETYPVNEDETSYPESGQGYDGQEDGSGYPNSNEAYNVQEEGVYPSQATEAQGHESEVHHGETTVSEQKYYVQDNVYAYPGLHQQVPESEQSGGLVSSGRVAYQIQDNGQMFHPHLQESRPEGSGGAVSQQQYYARDGYMYAHVRQGAVAETEALGVPVSSDQAAYHGQDDGLPYSSHLQNQAECNVQTRQVSSEQAYQDRYAYPMHLPYTQAYPQPHAYPMHFPHAHAYPMHLPETQVLQYGHAFAPHVHQPQASTSDVLGAGVTSQQVYASQNEASRSSYNAQEDGQTMPGYKHGSYG